MATSFETDGFFDNIYEFMPNETRSTIASGLNEPSGLAFGGNGDLFEADGFFDNINEFMPNETRSTIASGLNDPSGLAFASTTPELITLALLTAVAIGLVVYGLRRRAVTRTAKPERQDDGAPILAYPSHSSQQTDIMRPAA